MNTNIRRITTAGLALSMLTPAAMADARDRKAGWGAAAAIAGIGAVSEAIKGREGNAAALAAGAVIAYRQYDNAREDARDERFSTYPVDDRDGWRRDRDRDRNRDYDPYGYGRYDDRAGAPTWRSNPGRAGGGTGRTERYDTRTREVTGVITGTTGNWDRELRVDLDNGETRTIDVPRNITVRREGRSVSVHDLRSDEVVRVRIERFTRTGDLKANRVEVLGRYDRNGRFEPYGRGYSRPDRYDSRYDDPRIRGGRGTGPWFDPDRYEDRDGARGRWVGKVNTIDSRERIIRTTIDGRTVIVYADRADIRGDRGAMDIRDFNYGELVTIEGRRDGDRIYATRVTRR